MANPRITQERLKELVHYEPETGIFTWLRKYARVIRVGKQIGGLTDRGYIRMRVCGRYYFAQQLAWFYMTGTWAVETGLQLDHINRRPADNRWMNLRLITHIQNQKNRHLPIGISGVRGVRSAGDSRWRAMIHLGTFDSKQKAQAAYENAKNRLHLFGEL
jgi:hypothetical protein